MKTFINSRTQSIARLRQDIIDAFPELDCVLENTQIFIHKKKEDSPMLIITMNGRDGNMEVYQDSPYTDSISKVIGRSLTKNYDHTQSLLIFAEQFKVIPGVRVEPVNDNNTTIIMMEEIALRLRLWHRNGRMAIEIQPFENDGGRLLRSYIENTEKLLGNLEVFHSGNLVKYIIKVE